MKKYGLLKWNFKKKHALCLLGYIEGYSVFINSYSWFKWWLKMVKNINLVLQQSHIESVLREFTLSEGLFLVKVNSGNQGVF